MRIAIVSDIHGNLTALEAVLADLKQAAPDLILHGGDLAHGGSSPAGVVDRIRDLGWPGVAGNTDEMLFRPESLTEFARELPQLRPMWDAIEEMAASCRNALGDQRLAWLSNLPRLQIHGPITLLHASPESLWRAPAPTATDAELESVYSPLGQAVAVYGHIHHAFVRRISQKVIVNSGSVSLSYDGDPRASYLLMDGLEPEIRRVEYDVDRERSALLVSGVPHADWIAKILETARPQMP
jgi:predicted phosphodiesterase